MSSTNSMPLSPPPQQNQTILNQGTTIMTTPVHILPTSPVAPASKKNNRKKMKLGQTAILLNTNARSVSQRVVDTAVAVLGEDNVYVTTSAEQAQQAAAQIVEQGYSLVLPVGGDGTLSSLVNLMCQAIVKQPSNNNNNNNLTLEQAMAQLPAMAYLPLGTGNGVGSVVGNPVKNPRRGLVPGLRRRRAKHLERTLQRLQAIGTQLGHSSLTNMEENDEFEWIDMPMMQVTTSASSDDDGDDDDKDTTVTAMTDYGDLCFFAGVGFDSLMLNDFKRIKAWSIRTGVLTRFLSSVAGYCVALLLRTLPQTVWQGRHNIHVELNAPHVNSTLWIDHRRGDVVRPVSKSQLYQGITGILAAGTSPFYGGGLRLFPFARLTTDQMHLRVGRIHPLTGFLNIPQIFAGTYRDKSDRLGCLDFIGDEFEVRVSPASEHGNNNDEDDDDSNNIKQEKGYPFQHSGESVGHVERFRLRVVKQPVRFVCLKKQREE